MLESKVWRVDYRRLNPACYICSGQATIIAISSTTTGDVLVRTLCDAHARGEQDHCKGQGMVFAGSTRVVNMWSNATMMDSAVLKEMSEAAKVDPELLDDAVEALERRKELISVSLDQQEKSDD